MGIIWVWGGMLFVFKYGVYKWICLSFDNIIYRDDFNFMMRNKIILFRS